jgi:hypothetical protein
MLCYFLRDGHIAGVEMLPLGLSDEDAITRAHTLSSKRKAPFDGFEVWDHAPLRLASLRRDACAKPAVRLRTGRIIRNRGHIIAHPGKGLTPLQASSNQQNSCPASPSIGMSAPICDPHNS